MSDLFTHLFDWMAALSPVWAYIAVLAIAYGENIIPPIPGDVFVAFAGYLVGLGQLNFVIVVALATLGGALGFMTMYALGHRVGTAVLDPDRLRWIPRRQVRKARQWLHRWGYGVVVANRFLSGARSVIALTVGIAHMRPWYTAAAATLSAAVWTGLLTWAGYALGANWEVVSIYLREYGRVILVLMAAGAVGWGVRAWRRRKQRAAVADDLRRADEEAWASEGEAP